LRPNTKAPLAMTLTLDSNPAPRPCAELTVAPPANVVDVSVLATADIRSLAWSDLEC
jgi:hypothetical protein